MENIGSIGYILASFLMKCAVKGKGEQGAELLQWQRLPFSYEDFILEGMIEATEIMIFEN